MLNDLERDVSLVRDRVDWMAKKLLLAAMRENEGLSWSDPWLQAIDLEYHNIMPERGLFFDLLRQGEMRRLVSEDEIKTAVFMPPETTRAFFRGRAVAKFNRAIHSIQWDEIVFDEERNRTACAFRKWRTTNVWNRSINSCVRKVRSLNSCVLCPRSDN